MNRASPHHRIRLPRVVSAAVVYALLLLPSVAIGPHEILLLVNKDSPNSLCAANEFVSLRGVPPENIVYLSLPDRVLEPKAEISPEEFTRFIWEPATRVVKERGLTSRIIAWIYSVDFPVRITSDPPVSLQGITLVRNSLPEGNLIAEGRFPSAFFAGPDKAGGPMLRSQSLNVFHDKHGDTAPLASMMLGYTGARGVGMEYVLQCLRTSAGSDFTKPTGTVFYVVNNDIRSKCRDWQYPLAVSELARLGMEAKIVGNIDPSERSILGILMGHPSPTPMFGSKAYIPGCVAEHLTSAAGFFHHPDQVKLSVWFAVGVSASAGTITEPRAIWTKFPNARFFAHYASGCSVLESFAQSVRCPLQLLMVGEPFAKPCADRLNATLFSSKPAADGSRTIELRCDPDVSEKNPRFSFYVDGLELARDSASPRLELRGTQLSPGYHTVCGFTRAGNYVEQQAFASAGFTVSNESGGVRVSGIAPGAEVDLWHPVQIHAAGPKGTTGISLVQNARVLNTIVGKDGSLVLDPLQTGEGPQTLFVLATMEDGSHQWSAPLRLRVVRSNKAPAIGDIEQMTNAEGAITLRALATDAEGDPISFHWFKPLLPENTPAPDIIEGSLTTSNGVFKLSPEQDGEPASCVFNLPRGTAIEELQTDMSLSPGVWAWLNNQTAGLIFDVRGPKDFCFFGLDGETSAWMMARYRRGVREVLVTRGAIIPCEWRYTLALRKDENGRLAGYVNGEKWRVWPDDQKLGTRVGVVTLKSSCSFNNLMASPPPFSARSFQAMGPVLNIFPPAARDPGLFPLILQARDRAATSSKTIPAAP